MDTGGLGKKIAEELRIRRDLPIEPAQKTEKMAHIEILNDALRTQSSMLRRTLSLLRIVSSREGRR